MNQFPFSVACGSKNCYSIEANKVHTFIYFVIFLKEIVEIQLAQAGSGWDNFAGSTMNSRRLGSGMETE